jgi:hypothetical protein
MAKIIPLNNDVLRDAGILTLSTGAHVDMRAETIEEWIEAYKNLIGVIVDVHFKEVVKQGIIDGNYDNAYEILFNELSHILDNEIKDNRLFLEQILYAFTVKHFVELINEVHEIRQKESQKEEK